MTDFNVSIPAITHLPKVGSNPGNSPTKTAEQPLVRKIPGLEKFNPETKLSEEVSDYGDAGLPPGKTKETPAQEKAPKKTKEKPTAETAIDDKTSRHEKWKQQQADKKATAEQAKLDRKAKSQGLALEAMRAGNIHKAAELLGTTVPELLALTQNAALGIPQETKKLTPAEQKQKDDEDYRKTVEAKLAAHETFRYNTVANNYIRESITPLISDAEKYPMLNRDKEQLPKIQMGIYEYLNKELNETGTVPPVADIIETLEAEMKAIAKSTLQNLKGIKDFSEFFKQEEAEVAEKPAKPTKKAGTINITRKSPVDGEEEEIIEPAEEEPEEVETAPEEEDDEPVDTSIKPMLHFNSGAKIPFAFMSQADKVKFLARERKAGRI